MGNEIPIPAGLIEEPLDHAVDIIGEMFKDDPFQRYVLMDELAKRGETDVSYEHNREIFADVIPGILAGEARAITVAGSGISSVWYVVIYLPILFPYTLHNSFFFYFPSKSHKESNNLVLGIWI